MIAVHGSGGSNFSAIRNVRITSEISTLPSLFISEQGAESSSFNAILKARITSPMSIIVSLLMSPNKLLYVSHSTIATLRSLHVPLFHAPGCNQFVITQCSVPPPVGSPGAQFEYVKGSPL